MDPPVLATFVYVIAPYVFITFLAYNHINFLPKFDGIVGISQILAILSIEIVIFSFYEIFSK